MKKFKSLRWSFKKTMDMLDIKYVFCLMLMMPCLISAGEWNNLNCPAPRAPENGLSFIFRNGELVHFRCHPGYLMQGKPVSYCVNNVWTDPAPECMPFKEWPLAINYEKDMYNINRRKSESSPSNERQLFSWGESDNKVESHPRQGIYGDGPRRLPLINGIWPSQDQKETILSMGPQSTPGPKAMVKEEVDIAELRNKQLEELKQQRFTDTKGGKRRRGHKKSKKRKDKHLQAVDETVPRETVLSLGNTEEGHALSVSYARPENRTEKLHHKRRHRGHRKNKHHDKKYKVVHPTVSTFIISRPSRVDTSGISPHHTKYQFGSHYDHLEEVRRRPVEQVPGNQNYSQPLVGEYDTSCVDPLYGREIPKMAPLVPNAFVFRYETKKNKSYPFNSYMAVKYRCFSGYVFANANAQILYCRNGSWVGEIPRCIGGLDEN